MFRSILGFSAFSFLLLSGCGGGDAGNATIKGNVTYKGEKVTSGNLIFNSSTPGAKQANGTIKEDGTYLATGATSGKATVTFAPAISTEPVALKPGEKQKAPPFEGLMVKSKDIEVKAGQNTIDIELKK